MCGPRLRRMVQFRMRPSEQGSTMSAGNADLKASIKAVYSSSVIVPAVTAALLTTRVVDPIPAVLIAFQMGPELPSERPYNTVSKWR